jgi:hypothetical protein
MRHRALCRVFHTLGSLCNVDPMFRFASRGAKDITSSSTTKTAVGALTTVKRQANSYLTVAVYALAYARASA